MLLLPKFCLFYGFYDSVQNYWKLLENFLYLKGREARKKGGSMKKKTKVGDILLLIIRIYSLYFLFVFVLILNIQLYIYRLYQLSHFFLFFTPSKSTFLQRILRLIIAIMCILVLLSKIQEFVGIIPVMVIIIWVYLLQYIPIIIQN